MSPKQWWIAAACSVAVAGVLIFGSDSNLLHIVAMGFVFLALWMLKQRRFAARLKLSEALRDAVKSDP